MWTLINDFKKLLKSGVVGLNKRNADYILKYNPRKHYPVVDNKLMTKRIATENGIPVPKLLGVVEFQAQIKKLPKVLEKYSDFVIKPVRGSGGDGIIVISGKSGDKFRKVSGEFVDKEQLCFHVANILAGMYSLGNTPDVAIIEERIEFDPVFENIIYRGVPDIRIIVFKGVPIMSMIRLPTKTSDGRANLHQGAIGAGIDMKTGKTLTAVCNNEIIVLHPDTGYPVTDVQVPHWKKLLKLAADCGAIVGLGYIGVDIVLDRRYGPMILEMNARPGLAIQIANRAPLGPRLEMVESHLEIMKMSVDEKIQFTLDHF